MLFPERRLRDATEFWNDIEPPPDYEGLVDDPRDVPNKYVWRHLGETFERLGITVSRITVNATAREEFGDSPEDSSLPQFLDSSDDLLTIDDISSPSAIITNPIWNHHTHIVIFDGRDGKREEARLQLDTHLRKGNNLIAIIELEQTPGVLDNYEDGELREAS